MHKANVLQIIREEGDKESDAKKMFANVRLRLANEVASTLIRGSTSPERLGLFIDLSDTEAFLINIYKCVPGERIVVSPSQLSDAYGTILKSYEFLLAEYETTSEFFKTAWPKEVILEMMCMLSLEREDVTQKLSTEGRLQFDAKRAGYFIDLLRRAQTGLVGEVMMSDYCREMNEALAVVREVFGIKKKYI